VSLQSVLSRFGFAGVSTNGTYSPARAQTTASLRPAELPPRAIYDFLKAAYLSNGLYDGVRDAWAATGHTSPNLRPIRNPITAVVDCLGGKLYPEPLLVTTPRTQGITSQQEREQLEASDPIKTALDQVHLWSNWPRAKRKHARWVSLYGEAFVKVVADPLAGRVYYELIEPQYVTDYSIDVRDFLTSCRLDIPQCDITQAGTKHWVHTEQWDKDLQTVRVWRTDGALDAVANRPLWDLGQPAEETPLSAFGIDFVPICRAPFREIDDGRAIGAVLPAFEAIIEGDLSATNLHGLVFSDLAGAKVLKSIGNDAAGRPFAPPVVGPAASDGQPGRQADNTVMVGRREFWRLPGNQELQDVIPNINYAAALAILQDHDQHLERLLPAMAYVRISELQGGELSGRAMSYKMRAFVDQVEEGRANVLACLTQADMMALTMGAAAGIPIFQGLGSFEAGDYEHGFQEQPILAISSLDEAEEKRTIAQAAQALAAAGIPMSVILTDTLEMTEAEATEVVDAATAEAEAAFERQQELVAAQAAQNDTGGQFGGA
jgi:hypothetical protein